MSFLTQITYILTYLNPDSRNVVKFSLQVVMTTFRMTTGWPYLVMGKWTSDMSALTKINHV